MPMQISTPKLQTILKEYGYIGDISKLSVESLETYVRKYYGMRDSWKYKGCVMKDMNGTLMHVYEFDHKGPTVYPK